MLYVADWPLICVVAVMFFATLTRSTFGFGEALVAVPLLSFILRIETATALVAISSVCNSLVIMATSAKSTDWRGSWRLILSSMFGVPVGVYVLTNVPETLVKGLLSAVIILFAIFNLVQHQRWRLHSDRWAYPFGFVGGILGGAYNTSGPSFVIFGTLRHWTPEQFRSMLQGVFLTNAALVLLLHYSVGLWSQDVLHYLIWVLPLLVVTVPMGYWLNRRIHPDHFRRGLHVMLLALGIMLAWSTIRSR